MKDLMFASLAKSMNSFLHLDPESKQRMKKLRGKTISIEILPLHIEFQCLFNEDGISLMTDSIVNVDTVIRGTPIQMLGIMVDKKNRQKFFADDVIIEGNAETGQQVMELFDHMQIDWEEHLSKMIGDVPAYHTARLLGKFKNWLGTSEKNFQQDMSEYLHEEAKCLPSREALNDFFTDIDLLRMDVDRIEIRMQHLANNLNKKDEVAQ